MPAKSRAAAEHHCPHCGAVYDVTVRSGRRTNYHTAVCTECGDVMAQWSGWQIRRYRKKRRGTSEQFARTIVNDAAHRRVRKSGAAR